MDSWKCVRSCKGRRKKKKNEKSGTGYANVNLSMELATGARIDMEKEGMSVDSQETDSRNTVWRTISN